MPAAPPPVTAELSGRDCPAPGQRGRPYLLFPAARKQAEDQGQSWSARLVWTPTTFQADPSTGTRSSMAWRRPDLNNPQPVVTSTACHRPRPGQGARATWNSGDLALNRRRARPSPGGRDQGRSCAVRPGWPARQPGPTVAQRASGCTQAGPSQAGRPPMIGATEPSSPAASPVSVKYPGSPAGWAVSGGPRPGVPSPCAATCR